jgi:SRSO17 transposase
LAVWRFAWSVVGHWLLARRSSLTDLAWIAGTGWKIEEYFQQAKDACGLDHYQARTWRAWYAHATFAMITHALLVVTRAGQREKGAARSGPRKAAFR